MKNDVSKGILTEKEKETITNPYSRFALSHKCREFLRENSYCLEVNFVSGLKQIVGNCIANELAKVCQNRKIPRAKFPGLHTLKFIVTVHIWGPPSNVYFSTSAYFVNGNLSSCLI